MAVAVNFSKDFTVNSRGAKLCTYAWLPASGQVQALVFGCHGFGVHMEILFEDLGPRLASEGFAVFGMDCEGHGLSEGVRAFLPSFDALVNDYLLFFKGIRERPQYKGKPQFLVGESMGGAVALYLHRAEPKEYTGAVLVAPMCKISDEIKPAPIVVSIISLLSNVFPKYQGVPGPSVLDIAFRDPAKRKRVKECPTVYKEQLRFKTAMTLLHASNFLEAHLREVSVPFLLLHGAADIVTDPSISALLYEEAVSTDKTFKLYPGFWHSLLGGELPENTEVIFKDVIDWLNERL